MDNVKNDQGQPDMQLIETIKQVLETGVLSMTVEREIYAMLNSRQSVSETEQRLVEQLMEALQTGRVHPIA
jgi:hypothetical protein